MIAYPERPGFPARELACSGRVGAFAVGHHLYWPQFPGLKERLLGHWDYFAERLSREGAATILPAEGLVDHSRRAGEVGNRFAREQLDLLVCFVATYTPSANVLPVVQRARAPLVLVGLQPSARMDYPRACTEMQLENDNVTSLPEIAGALDRAHLQPADCLVGMLYEDERTWSRLRDWCQVATVHHELRNARLGAMGHVYEGMLDMNSDPTMLEAHFGLHVEHLEMEDLQERVEAVTDGELRAKVEEIHRIFLLPEPGADPIAGPVKPEDLNWSARVACGLDRLVADFGLTGLAYYYRGLHDSPFERLAAGMIVGNSILTGRGVPVAGELDLKNCVAMLILDRLGAGGSFAEFHPVDFEEDFVLVGHDGPAHIAIADRRPVLRGLSLYHGKRGSGASVEFQIKTGPLTILGLTQTYEGQFKMVVAEGKSLAGPIPATGNTNTRGKFPPDVRTFLERWTLAGPTHHFALGTGHIAPQIERLGRILKIPTIRVTP